jgi:hypothetical protein
MTTGQWLLLSLAVALVPYGTCVGGLVVARRRSDATSVARFIPDCIILFRRLVADPRVPLGRKLLLVALIAYLAAPFDLIPRLHPGRGPTRRRDPRRARPAEASSSALAWHHVWGARRASAPSTHRSDGVPRSPSPVA